MRKSFGIYVSIFVLASLLIKPICAGDIDQVTSEHKKIAGKWKIKKLLIGGAQAEDAEKMGVNINGIEMIIHGSNPKEIKYKIYLDSKTHHVELVCTNLKIPNSKGIYELKKGRLKLLLRDIAPFPEDFNKTPEEGEVFILMSKD